MAIVSMFCLAALAFAGFAGAGGNPEVAALQVGLRERGLYRGTVDGVLGPGTERAVLRFQRRAGLSADGVPGPRTRKALGRYGKRAPLGGRPLLVGMRGWDVAALQFALAWHGFPVRDLRRRLRTQHRMRRCAVFSVGPGSRLTASPARVRSLPSAGPCPVLLCRWRDR